MMSFNHKDRPTLQQIRKHPWMTKKDAPKNELEKRVVREEVIQ